MDKHAKLQLMFAAGLSTSEEVSDVSGRGVGMDVVKKTVEKLDGQIFIESEVDEGLKITISLPLTLAITEALMLKVKGEVFALPLNSINETMRIKQKDIKRINGEEVITFRDKTIPLLDSRAKLNMDYEQNEYKDKEEISVVVVNSSGKLVALKVDELLHQQEIVIKSLSDYLDNVKNISGATIIGDGEVALILDVRDIA
jgi:two-component system chemotaxis sensor kinase CheA